MAGTKAGGIKSRDKNLARDPDHYKKIGARGGANGHTGGFAAMSREDRRKYGKLGGHLGSRIGFTREQYLARVKKYAQTHNQEGTA